MENLSIFIMEGKPITTTNLKQEIMNHSVTTGYNSWTVSMQQHVIKQRPWGLKGNSHRKKVKLKWKSLKSAKRRAITDLNVPNGSCDIPFQSQEFGQDGHRHFVGFQPRFHLNMTSQMQYCKTMKKWKCNILGFFCLICLKFCRLLELGKWFRLISNFIAMATKIKMIVYYWKTKGLLFKQKWCSESNLKQYSLIVSEGSVKFWRKIGDTLLKCEKTIGFVSEQRLIILVWVAITTKF